MKNIKMGKVEMPVGSMIVLVGAFLGAISIFLGYVNFDYTILDDVTYSGWDVITGWEGAQFSFVHWAPLVIMITAIVGLIMAAVPIFVKLNVNIKVYNTALAVILLVGVIFSIIFIAMGGGTGLYSGDYLTYIESQTEVFKNLKLSLGYGPYHGLICMAAALVGSIYNIKWAN